MLFHPQYSSVDDFTPERGSTSRARLDIARWLDVGNYRACAQHKPSTFRSSSIQQEIE